MNWLRASWKQAGHTAVLGWVFGGLLTVFGQAADAADPVPPADPEASSALVWHDDYARAMEVAQAEQKMMLVYFRGTDENKYCAQFEQKSLTQPRVQDLLNRYVLVRVGVDAQITVQGQPLLLLDHPSFAEMLHQQGLAIIDFAHPGGRTQGQVVSEVPFVRGKYYQFKPQHLAVLLDLPVGTLTQRTLVFAVRIHPEAPASTGGEVDNGLMKEARSHSDYQARIRLQGHHSWDRRFSRINRFLPRGLRAQEVCAESWPHENLLDAAVDVVGAWRQSSGHWSAVRAQQVRFGYDMRRGSNGIWYATGIFGNRQ